MIIYKVIPEKWDYLGGLNKIFKNSYCDVFSSVLNLRKILFYHETKLFKIKHLSTTTENCHSVTVLPGNSMSLTRWFTSNHQDRT